MDSALQRHDLAAQAGASDRLGSVGPLAGDDFGADVGIVDRVEEADVKAAHVSVQEKGADELLLFTLPSWNQ